MMYCTDHCGTACVDGSCPKYYSTEPYSCNDCPYNNGCSDCMYLETKDCPDSDYYPR